MRGRLSGRPRHCSIRRTFLKLASTCSSFLKTLGQHRVAAGVAKPCGPRQNSVSTPVAPQ